MLNVMSCCRFFRCQPGTARDQPGVVCSPINPGAAPEIGCFDDDPRKDR